MKVLFSEDPITFKDGVNKTPSKLWLSSRTWGGGGGQFNLGKRTNKIEHDGIGTCASIEISGDADNAEQKVKWFLKVHETYKLLWEAYLNFLFSQVFIQVHILQNF